MRPYVVVDTNPGGRLIALRDAAGRLHVVSVTCEVPAIGASFDGMLPMRGSNALFGASGDVLRVTFQLVDCSQTAALAWLHADFRDVPPPRVFRDEAPSPQHERWAIL